MLVQTVNQNFICILQGSAVTFFKHCGQVRSHLCQYSSRYRAANIIGIGTFLMKLYKTRNMYCWTWSLSNATFSFLITWRSSSSKSAVVYNILWKSDDFSLRYNDISIFKMAAVRHLGIVLPPYETNHEVSVTGRSCLSNFMSMWYTDMKI